MTSQSQAGHLPRQYARQRKGVMTRISALMKALDDEDSDFVVLVIAVESNKTEKDKSGNEEE